MKYIHILFVTAIGFAIGSIYPAYACSPSDILCRMRELFHSRPHQASPSRGLDDGDTEPNNDDIRPPSITSTAGIVHPMVPIRAFLRSADIPPAEFGAYGVMALRARPTSVTRDRLRMACASFVAYLPRRIDVPKSIGLSDLMLTIWPIDSPDAAELGQDNCDFMLDHYELFAADSAIRDAAKQGAHFGNDGPFLIGWSPSNTRGLPDKLVLVVDMSSYTSQDSFNQALRFWKEKVAEDPSLWRSGFSLERFRLALRDFVDHYGETILAAAKLSKD